MVKCQGKHQAGEKRQWRTRNQGHDKLPRACWPQPPGHPRPGCRSPCCCLFSRNHCKLFPVLSFWYNQVLRCLGRKFFMCQYFKGILLCERESGKRKSQYKNKSNLRWIFFEIRRCLLLFISLPSLHLYSVIKVPFPTVFANDQNSGALLVSGRDEMCFSIWKIHTDILSISFNSGDSLPNISLEST